MGDSIIAPRTDSSASRFWGGTIAVARACAGAAMRVLVEPALYAPERCGKVGSRVAAPPRMQGEQNVCSSQCSGRNTRSLRQLCTEFHTLCTRCGEAVEDCPQARGEPVDDSVLDGLCGRLVGGVARDGLEGLLGLLHR